MDRIKDKYDPDKNANLLFATRDDPDTSANIRFACRDEIFRDFKSAIRNPKSQIILIGVGNEFRGDDAVGLLIARRLTEMNLPGVTVRELSGEGAALMEAWQGADAVFLFDAVFTGKKPAGTIYRMDAHAQTIPADFFHYSTHRFGAAEAVELARELGQLPLRLIIFGVEGEDFDYGAKLSPAVEKTLPEVINQIATDLKGF